MRSAKIVIAVVAVLACLAFIKAVTTAPEVAASADTTAPMPIADLTLTARETLPVVAADPAY